MAKVQCPKCKHSFEGSALKGAAAAAAGAAIYHHKDCQHMFH